MTRTSWAPRREVQLWVALQQVFWGLEFWHGHRSPQLSPGSRPIFQKLEERVTLNHFSVCAGQYYAWLIALGMVAYYSSLLLHCYILLVTELFSFPVPGQSWNRLWMCVGQGEGKLRVTVSLHSGAFSFSIKLAAFRLPVGLAFFFPLSIIFKEESAYDSLRIAPAWTQMVGITPHWALTFKSLPFLFKVSLLWQVDWLLSITFINAFFSLWSITCALVFVSKLRQSRFQIEKLKQFPLLIPVFVAPGYSEALEHLTHSEEILPSFCSTSSSAAWLGDSGQCTR